jgi:5-deoxy-D-glucuronate isomerase
MTKSKPNVQIIDVTSGEVITREATAEEIAQIKIDADVELTRRNELEAKIAQRQALLDRLGITADEAKLLLG